MKKKLASGILSAAIAVTGFSLTFAAPAKKTVQVKNTKKVTATVAKKTVTPTKKVVKTVKPTTKKK